MRMLLLAAGVAAAVLAAVVFVGLRLVDEEEPPWSEQASLACEQGLADARATVSAGADAATDAQRAIEVYTELTEIEGGVLDELEALPRPADDELAIERLLGMLTTSHQADLVIVRRLRRSFDRELIQRRVSDTIPILADARAGFGALGAGSCVRYYDPASYP